MDKKQPWFWTERWQEGEKEADADIRAGRVKFFNNAEEAISYLHKESQSYRLRPSKNV